MIRIRHPDELAFDRTRKRMIRETEIALAVALRHPERIVRIPTVEVGCGDFHPSYAAEFWAQILE